MDFTMFENMKFDSERSTSQSTAANVSTDSGQMSCGCDISRFPDQTPLAMSYTPMQQWSTVYNESEGLSSGTIFPELNMPFEPEVC